ncbi:acetyl-CoA hydrolase/transferase family protein [Paraconexibacter algicola]|uniref:4-hydroxybutyrate CoA-transferase n=1 Tax=Paraconexibacter algicola TaxID=2133960 RepID=A0A2T4UJY0_9ACTN|nr:acetyl-CoA hydrolase/transferase C-terminal domain-containing protein [Paraconexibacter algicola]PTL59507.1 4-hydroxybutyrate CoA-transferase [Paraconexibacter algicola]
MAGDLDLTRWLRPGDGVVVGNLSAEPLPLVRALWRSGVPDLEVFLGMSLHDHAADVPDGIRVRSYGGLGRTGRIPGLEVVPTNYSALPRAFAEGLVRADVVLLQVTPPDADGRCALGVAADYLPDAIAHARVVIAQVNARLPRVGGATIPFDAITHAIELDEPVHELHVPAPGEVERAIAAHVAPLVRDGDTLQMGIGALPDAILAALHDRADLGVHSGMITDGVLDLLEAGVVTGARKPTDTGLTVTGALVGTRRLFDAVDGRDDVVLRTVSATHSAARLGAVGRLVALNGALEVDLDGNAGCESIDGRPIGAIGGQGDFLRAAVASGGVGVVALPAARIVERLHGPVSTTRADLDVVVTEHGVAHLRGHTPTARRRALQEISG